MSDENVVERVCLLAMFIKQPDETMQDVQAMLVDTGMFDTKECKKVFRMLKKEQYIDQESNQLTLKGIIEAKEAERMFKQP